jgi:hypothetical protein
MVLDDALERLVPDEEERKKWIGVYIGVLAVLLAICGVGGGNATKDAMRANIEASNTWAFFQAKNIRRNAVNLVAEQLELTLSTQPDLPPATKAAYQAKIREYRATAQRLTSEPDKQEGLEELSARAKALEQERDVALRKDPYFDWSQAFLQIAIVLASVHLIIGSAWLLGMSGVIALLGVVLMLNGFTLFFGLPFLG